MVKILIIFFLYRLWRLFVDLNSKLNEINCTSISYINSELEDLFHFCRKRYQTSFSKPAYNNNRESLANQGKPEAMHVNEWLVDNYFGDYYTHKELDYKQPEMITFCFLKAQGGCELQFSSHAKDLIRKQ